MTTAPEGEAPRRNLVPLGLAVGLLIVIAFAVFMRLSVHGPQDAGDPARGATPLAGLEPASGAELDAAPALLRWPAQAGATGYLVTLRDGSGTLIWRSDPISEPHTALPASLAVQISPGRTYLWSVGILGPPDLAELGPFSFRLR